MSESYAVSSDTVIFTIHLPNGDITMRWDEVFAISVSYVNTINHGLVYIIFDYENGEYVEVENQMEGFEQFIAVLPDHFPTSIAEIQEAIDRAQSGDVVVLFQR